MEHVLADQLYDDLIVEVEVFLADSTLREFEADLCLFVHP